MKKFLLLSFMLMFAFTFSDSWAQERTVSGKVTSVEDGSTLPGVNVVLKGTTTGTVTDIDGNYKLTVPSDAGTLVFSFIGLATEEVQIGTRSVIDLQMAPDVQQLSEVVVTGYKSYTKEKSNISAVTVNADKIQSRPNPSVIQTLSGQVPGLSITTATGQPGGNSTVNLRGVTSINGDTEPLFIIDGAPVDQDNFRSLNPNEIASVNVLKDAGATAIYGNRGANGVIVIETKRGNYDSPLEITYSFQRSSSTLQENDYDLMDSNEQLLLERQYGSGLGATSFPTQSSIDNAPVWVDKSRAIGTALSDAEIAAAPTTDWADYFFSDGIANQHNLQFRKGGASTTAFLSLGYLDQEGILQSSSLKRYNLRSNLTGKSDNDKFNFGVNLSINYSESEEPNAIGGSGINRNYVLGAYQSVPYLSEKDYVDGEDLLSPLVFSNTPLFLIDRLRTYTRTEDEVKIIGSVNVGYEIIDGLTANFRASGDFQTENLIRAEGPTSFNALLFAETGNTTPGFQQQQYNQEFLYNQVANLNYERTFGGHNFNLGLYTEYFKAHQYSFGFFNEGLNQKTFFPGDGAGFVDDNAANDFFVDDINANIAESGLFSYFGQLDYDFESRFGATLTLRRDASSRFAESNRWATFYSIAGRWNIHNEAFASGLPFDALKLRASYGTNGNQDITGLGYFSALDLTRPLFATGAGYGGANAVFLNQIPNADLKWETVTQGNVGIDAEMFNGRFRATIEGYVKTTSDLYQSAPVSAVNSVTTLDQNIGELQNRGMDLMLAYDILRKNDLKLTVNFVGNYNKQEILDLPGDEDELIGTGRVGGKLFEYYDYRYAGVNPANGNLLFLTADGEVTENPNVDTDRVWLDKNIYPDYQGSFGVNFDFKGFFLTTQFNYTIGVDRYDFDLSGFQDPTNIGQFRHTRDMDRAWTPDNRVTDIPSLTASNIDLDGDRYLTDASYLRLRFASVGYNVPKSLLEKVGLRMARVYVNGENLVTFTEWRGFDAEALDNTSRIYPTPRTWSVGVELGL